MLIFGHMINLGLLIGHKVVGMRMVLEDGVSHSVDSSENAFKAAAMGAMRTCKCKQHEHWWSQNLHPKN